ENCPKFISVYHLRIRRRERLASLRFLLHSICERQQFLTKLLFFLRRHSLDHPQEPLTGLFVKRRHLWFAVLLLRGVFHLLLLHPLTVMPWASQPMNHSCSVLQISELNPWNLHTLGCPRNVAL